jgi:hypothetical protein
MNVGGLPFMGKLFPEGLKSFGPPGNEIRKRPPAKQTLEIPSKEKANKIRLRAEHQKV